MNVFGSVFSPSVTLGQFLLAAAGSVVIGFLLSFFYMFRCRYSRSMAASLVLFPMMITVAIMMVNGNLGAGVAVAGIFNLVRFRSIKASARELACIFAAMAAGLACGIGYLGIAFLFTLMVVVIGMALSLVHYGEPKADEHLLKITVPESLNKDGVFEEVLKNSTDGYRLISMKTTAMGSLFRVTYEIRLSPSRSVQKLIDEIRLLNGNMEVEVSLPIMEEERV